MTYFLAMYFLGVYFVFTSLVCYFKNEVCISSRVMRELFLSSLGSWFMMGYVIHLFLFNTWHDLYELDFPRE